MELNRVKFRNYTLFFKKVHFKKYEKLNLINYFGSNYIL